MLKEKMMRSKVQRILRDPVGIKILGEELGLDIYHHDDDAPVPPKIAVLVPSYKTPHPLMKDSATVAFREATRVASIFYPPSVSSCVVHWARNLLIAELLKSKMDFSHVLMIDDDMIVPKDAVVKMLARNVDIVAGIATTRNDPPVPNALVKGKHPGDYEKLLYWDNPEEMIQVDGIGAALMLVSKRAIMGIAEYTMSCRWEKDTWGKQFGIPEDHERFRIMEQARREYFEATHNAHWFQFLQHSETMHMEYGEDISFCVKAANAGFPVWCDTTIQPGHIGEYPYSFKDFEAQVQEPAMAFAAANSKDGKPGGRVRFVDED